MTSAGVTAGIDLTLALVSEDHGSAISLSCAKGLVVVAQRQGGQSQFSPLLLPPSETTTPLGKVQAYVMDHIREAFPVERLAKIAGVSARSIARLFVRDLGVTPHEFIEGIRIDQARNLLEATELALKAVAFDCGFASRIKCAAPSSAGWASAPFGTGRIFGPSCEPDFRSNELPARVQGGRAVTAWPARAAPGNGTN